MRVVVLALIAAACRSDDDKAADTGTTTVETCPTPLTGPTALARVDVTCDAAGNIGFFAETAYLSGGGVVFAIDGADPVPWSEEHDLESTEQEPCGAWDHVDRVVAASASTPPVPEAYERNVASAYTCADHVGTDVMTYAFLVFDPSGEVADCVAAGADPQGLVDGTYDRSFTTDPSFALAECDAGALGR